MGVFHFVADFGSNMLYMSYGESCSGGNITYSFYMIQG